jgi:hypothetical protein
MTPAKPDTPALLGLLALALALALGTLALNKEH